MGKDMWASGGATVSGSSNSLNSDLLMSPKPVLIALAVAGMIMVIVLSPQAQSVDQLRAMFIAVLSQMGVVAIWHIGRRYPQAERWLTLLAFTAAVSYAGTSMPQPVHLVLSVVPGALAVALIGTAAGAILAATETVLLVVGSILGSPQPGIFAAVVAIWSVLALSAGIRGPLMHVDK